MIDRPDAARLLRAMATTLSDDVVPACHGPAQHAARVVANLCRILERESAAGGHGKEETQQALATLLNREGSLEELVSQLDEKLRSRSSPTGASRLLAQGDPHRPRRVPT